MKDETQINAWLDQWDEWQETHPGCALHQFAQECLSTVPAVARNEFLRVAEKLERVDREIQRQVGTTDPRATPQSKTRVSIWKPGTEPIPGYRLENCLGSGGFGEVWRALAPGGVPIALKFVRFGTQFGDREQRALDIIKSIRHPHLIGVSGSWEKDGWLVMAMELADRTLAQRLDEANQQGFAGIPIDELLRYMAEAAEALDFLNEPCHPTGDGKLGGVQHRDVKPQNLLLVGRSLKVADFGLARLLVDQTAISHTGGLTPSYAAPEFYNGKTSSQSDQYSLAMTYCHLRGGRLPFTGSSAELMLGHISKPPDLSMLPIEERGTVAKALAKAPHERWPSCSAFVETLRRVQSEGPQTQTPRWWQNRLAKPIAAIGGVAVAILLMAAFIASRGDKDKNLSLNTSPGFPSVAGISPATSSNNEKRSQGARSGPGSPPLTIPVPSVPAPVPSDDQSKLFVGERPGEEWEGNGMKMKFCWCPAGSFKMGSMDSDKDALEREKPQVDVRLSRGFWLGKYEVTQSQWERLMGTTPWKGLQNVKEGAEFPACNVSWNYVVEFCKTLVDSERKAGRLSASEEYRLPTEAEWEYACRSGQTARYSFGDAVGKISEYAWWGGLDIKDGEFIPGNGNAQSEPYAHPVGLKKPNTWGLYDMHGNVWEWCSDWYGERLPGGLDPSGSPQGPYRVFRGGCWFHPAHLCRSACRTNDLPTYRRNGLGFRLALSPSSK